MKANYYTDKGVIEKKENIKIGNGERKEYLYTFIGQHKDNECIYLKHIPLKIL